VFNAAVSRSIPISPLASLTEQSPRAFGRGTTQPYDLSEVQSLGLQKGTLADAPGGGA
jgi:hypothetical protein